MKTTLFDGAALAEQLRTDLAVQVQALGTQPHLAAVCVGDDDGVRSFVKLKQKAAQEIGVQFSSYFFDANDEEGARTTLAYLATDDTIDGIFVELPLPASWDSKSFLSLIPEAKDVDARRSCGAGYVSGRTNFYVARAPGRVRRSHRHHDQRARSYRSEC
jgi:methylenetetrahydrofolate dehydrogenase (NADP+)/methenyltetrahydrofolate cyclohydrolase